MREQLQKRLKALKTEYAAGQKALANLEAQQLSLRETLLRIGGAIQVLEEELATVPDRESEDERSQPSPTPQTPDISALTSED
jgi:chromosome segregation ATPase